ncbi:MAG: DUF2088 domain-containing protein, partial [Planctomycetales bacterium]|nr:DUF2088 domain-containing protein [Planctomycetales bacterium]
MPHLQFGTNRSFRLDLEDVTSIEPRTSQDVCIDPATAVVDALSHPLEFPPLAKATVPGDHAAVAIADSAPQRADLALGVVESLCGAGVEPDDVTLVLESPLDDESLLLERLQRRGFGGVQLETHNPDDDDRLAMVGVDENQEPLRLNRTLVEADLTMLVTGAPPHRLLGGSPGAYAGLYPQFGSRENLRLYYS